MRGLLGDEIIDRIQNTVPRINQNFMLITSSSAKIDGRDLENKSKVHVALVCLGDACHRFNYTRIALLEAVACKKWYLEYSPQAPNELVAISSSKFYLDYATLLLYATAEDIAYFIVNYLGIEDQVKAFIEENQEKLEKKNVSSQAAKVGLLLAERFRDNPITHIVLKLRNNDSWVKALDYRNCWVHEKPPIIAGLGIEYDRKSRISADGKGKRITFGGGSPHKYTVDELTGILKNALDALASAIDDLLEIILKERQAKGETFNFEKNTISHELW